MFCQNCGRQLFPQNNFCPTCGLRLDKIADAPNVGQSFQQAGSPNFANQTEGYQPNFMPTNPPPSQFDSIMHQMIGDNSDYYMREFSAIEAGLPSKFNICSFFFNVWHMLYRGMWRSAVVRFGGPIILSFISMLMTVILINNASDTYILIALVLAMISGLWHLIVTIVTAVQFNRLYKNHLESIIDDKKLMENPQYVYEVSKKYGRTHPGLVAAVWGGLLILSVSCSIILSASLLLNDTHPFDFNFEFDLQNMSIVQQAQGNGIYRRL